jgi:iron complex transport system permease protein
VGALVALLILYRISTTQFGFSIYTLLLAGVILSAIFSALIMFLTSVSEPNLAFGMYAWLMGSLTGPDYSTLGILVVYLGMGLLVLGSQAQSLNILTMGEEAARSLGVEVERVKKLVFVATALITGAVVAFSGLIGFVGLIVPHAVRLAVSADHRLLLPVAGLTGGVFLMVADTAARTLISPSEIPVGVITALVGGPVFLYLLVNRRARVVI